MLSWRLLFQIGLLIHKFLWHEFANIRPMPMRSPTAFRQLNRHYQAYQYRQRLVPAPLYFLCISKSATLLLGVTHRPIIFYLSQ